MGFRNLLTLKIEGLITIIPSLYQLSDPDLILVYILPFEISLHQVRYYEYLLSLMDISHVGSRLHFICPELRTILPSHMPLGNVLWYSSKALKMIKNISCRCSGGCTIIPTTAGWSEKRISNYLGKY